MKSYREELWFETKTRRAYLNITSHVEAIVKKSGVAEGLVLVNAMHITASVYINDDKRDCFRTTIGFWRRSPLMKPSTVITTPARITEMRTSSAN